MRHGENMVDCLGAEVDRIEKNLKQKHPEVPLNPKLISLMQNYPAVLVPTSLNAYTSTALIVLITPDVVI